MFEQLHENVKDYESMINSASKKNKKCFVLLK